MFTPEELAEMAAADAAIEASFRMTTADYAAGDALDADARRSGWDNRRRSIAAKKKAYYEENRDAIAAKQKAYREENREKYNAYQREYRRKRREMGVQHG